MNLQALFSNEKSVQTHSLFQTTEGKVVALFIAKANALPKHITKVPALLVCISGTATYWDENDHRIHLQSGTYVEIPVNVHHWIDATEDTHVLLIK